MLTRHCRHRQVNCAQCIFWKVLSMTAITNECLKVDKQLCFSIYKLSNAIIRSYRPLLKTLDLTYLQYIVMMVLWEHEQVTVKEIGEKLTLDSGTLTPLLKRLDAKGLISRTRCTNDERVRNICLTAEGVKLRELALTVPEKMQCQTGMGYEELAAVKKGCDQLLASLNESE